MINIRGQEITIKQLKKKAVMKDYKKMEIIHRNVCKVFEVDFDLTFMKTRKREIVEARQVTMELTRKLLGSSQFDTGYYFRKDHATVIHAEITVKNLRDTDELYNSKYTHAERICKRMLKIKPKMEENYTKKQILQQLKKLIYKEK